MKPLRCGRDSFAGHLAREFAQKARRIGSNRLKKCAAQISVVLLVSLAIAGTSSAQSRAQNLRLANLSEKLSRDMHSMAENFDGVMGIYVKDLTSGQKFEVNSDVIFPQASSIKIPILIELMRQAQEGKLRLDERVSIHRAALVGGSGVLQFFADGQSSISIHDLAVLMVVLSDNSATNMLIDRIGMQTVNSLLDSLGLH